MAEDRKSDVVSYREKNEEHSWKVTRLYQKRKGL